MCYLETINLAIKPVLSRHSSLDIRSILPLYVQWALIFCMMPGIEEKCPFVIWQEEGWFTANQPLYFRVWVQSSVLTTQSLHEYFEGVLYSIDPSGSQGTSFVTQQLFLSARKDSMAYLPTSTIPLFQQQQKNHWHSHFKLTVFSFPQDITLSKNE